MANTIITRRSSTASAVPTAGQLQQGELALNIADEKLYSKNSSNVVFEIGASSLADGTVEGQMAYWDNTGGAWTATDRVRFDGVSGELRVYDNLAGGDYLSFTHDGLAAQFGFNATSDVVFDGFSGSFLVESRPIRATNGGAAYTELSQSGTTLGQVITTANVLQLQSSSNVRTANGVDFFIRGGDVRVYDSTVLDYLSISVGATDIDFQALGNVPPIRYKFQDAPLFLEERAAKATNLAAYGQIWVKTGTPNTLWFTDDADTDFQLGVGGGIADGTVTNATLYWNGSAWVENSTVLSASGKSFIVAAAPIFEMRETDAAANEGYWDITSVAGQLRFRAVNDALSGWTNFLTVDRTATNVTSVNIVGSDFSLDGLVTGGLVLEAQVAASVTDLSDHLTLYNPNYGFNITASNINAVAAGVNSMSWSNLRVESKQMFIASDGLAVNGIVNDQGQVGQFTFLDVSGGFGRVGSYDYDGTGWNDVKIIGDNINIDTQGGVLYESVISGTTGIGWKLSDTFGMAFSTGTASGGWARGMVHHVHDASTATAGFGFLGSNDAVTQFSIGFGSAWWSTHEVLRVAPTAITIDSLITTLTASSTDADFDALTATSYGGIVEANLVDKTAAENISGIWSWTGAGQINLDDNVELRIGTGNDITMLWDGTDLEITGAASGQIWNWRDGPVIRLWDSGDTKYFGLQNNGTNLLITESGLTNIVFPAAGTLGIRMEDNTLDQPIIQDYAIESASLTVSANAVTLTYANGPAFEVDLEAATGAVTITLSGGPPAGTYGEIIVKVQQDTTASRTITWAGGTFEWPGGTAPIMTATADAIDIFHFSTWNGGTTWFGSVIQDCK